MEIAKSSQKTELADRGVTPILCVAGKRVKPLAC